MTGWLIDKSALVRLFGSPDAAEWAARIERGLVRITPFDAAGSGLFGTIRRQLARRLQTAPRFEYDG